MEAFQMQCDDRRQPGYQHLLPSAGVNLLHLLIYDNNKNEINKRLHDRDFWSYGKTAKKVRLQPFNANTRCY